MTEPTDAEIIALADETRTAEGSASGYILPISFARAVLAKWATPPAVVGEPVAWLDPWTGAKVTTDYDAYGKHGIPLYTAPQPTQAQAGAVPLTDEQIDDYIRHADAGGRWGEAFAQGVRWAIRHYERAHGIGIKKGDRHGLKT